MRGVWNARSRRAASRQVRGQTWYESVYSCGGRWQSMHNQIERCRTIEMLHRYWNLVLGEGHERRIFPSISFL
jgi:hypothetical protein